MDPLVIGFTSATLGILCGLTAIIGGIIDGVRKRKNELFIRQSIIENHIDAETAKVLVTADKPKKKNPYASLNWGLMLMGIGLGYLLALGLGLENVMSQFILMALGCGVGLFVSFIISHNMDKGRQSLPDDGAQNA